MFDLFTEIGKRHISNMRNKLLMNFPIFLSNLHKTLNIIFLANRNNHQTIFSQLRDKPLWHLISCRPNVNSIKFYIFVKRPSQSSVSCFYSYFLLQQGRVTVLNVLD